MSTRKTADRDGAQTRRDDDPRPWTPISDGNGDTFDDVDDAEPDAGVVVRPERTVWVTQRSRYNSAYHIFPDCHMHGDAQAPEVAAEMPARLSLCEHCETREQVRVAVSDDQIPPNPVIGAGGDDPHTPTARGQMPDGVTRADAGDWLDAGSNGTRTNPRNAQHEQR